MENVKVLGPLFGAALDEEMRRAHVVSQVSEKFDPFFLRDAERK